MKLIKSAKIEFTAKNPFPRGEVVGSRWLLIGRFCQIGHLKGHGFKVRNISKDALWEGEFFQSLKEAMNFAKNEGLI